MLILIGERSQTLDPQLAHRRQGSRFNIHNTSGANLQPSPLTFEPGRPLHRMIRTTPIGTPKSPQKISIVQSTYNSANNSPTTIRDHYNGTANLNNNNHTGNNTLSPTRGNHSSKLKLQHEDSNDSITGLPGLRLQKSTSSCGSTDDEYELSDAIPFNNLHELLPIDIPDVTISIPDSPYGSTDGLDKRSPSDNNSFSAYPRLPSPSGSNLSPLHQPGDKFISQYFNNTSMNGNTQEYQSNHKNHVSHTSSFMSNNNHRSLPFSNRNGAAHQSNYDPYRNNYYENYDDDRDSTEFNKNYALSNFSFSQDDVANASKCTAV